MLACPVHGGEDSEGDEGIEDDEDDVAAVLLLELLKTDW
jgi:hypothetical protein